MAGVWIHRSETVLVHSHSAITNEVIYLSKFTLSDIVDIHTVGNVWLSGCEVQGKRRHPRENDSRCAITSDFINAHQRTCFNLVCSFAE